MNTAFYGIIGKPVIHSLSPVMHNAAFGALGVDAHYTRIAVESAEEALRLMEELPLCGINVTAPFKEEMRRIVHSLDDFAERTGAVNTVVRKGSIFHGFNTDVVGVAESFRASGVSLHGKKAIVLGAGGAARAAVCALQSENAEVVILDRTRERARTLALEFKCEGDALQSSKLKAWIGDASVIVNTTSTSERIISPENLHDGLTILDSYYAEETALVADSKVRGARILGTYDWLIHQGIKAFSLFTGLSASPAIFEKAIASHEYSSKKGITLIGMMGSGKSSIAKVLSESTGLPRIELDERVEKAAGKSVGVLFNTEGEAVFRDLEARALRDAFQEAPAVLSTGGGAILNDQSRTLLKEKSIVGWLWARPHVLAERIGDDPGRVLLGSSDRKTKLAEILQKRFSLYADTSDIIFPTEQRSIKEIAERITYEASKR